MQSTKHIHNPLSLGVMDRDQLVSFSRAWRPMTASEELAVHNGYIAFSSPVVLEFREGIFIRRGDR